VVEKCNLVFGGMAATTLAAKATASFMVGKKFAELETLEGSMSALEEDFNLPFGVPGGMASYRKSLALGFFYRFYHEVMAELGGEGEAATAEHIDKDAVEELEREISTGAVDLDTTAAYEQEIVGKGNPHLAALKQTTGEAQYTDDIPPLANELHGCLVLSTKAHAKILSVDYSAALAIPVVVDYVDRHDLPRPELNRWGAPHFEEVFFAEDEVFSTGQPIALILAKTALKAAEAARAVKVEYEELPAVFTIEEAIEKESFFKFFREIKKGDPEAAFAKCDHVFTGVARMGGQEHFYLETNASLAVPKPEDGEMEIYSSTQNPNEA
jgi:xanthine dehydrogenase/oxidase